jgi:hypothetical protein
MEALDARIESLEATLCQPAAGADRDVRSLNEVIDALKRDLAPILALDAQMLLREDRRPHREEGRVVESCSFIAALPRVRRFVALLERVTALRDRGVVEAHPLLTTRRIPKRWKSLMGC